MVNEKITREDVNGINIKYIENTNDLYAVSTEGNVYSFTDKSNGRKIGKYQLGHYLATAIKFADSDQFRHMYIHRLVAMAFIENPEPETKKYVNHLDENPKNNNVSNLQWCTQKENCNYGTKPLKMRNVALRYLKENNIAALLSKRVALIDEQGNLVKVYASIKEAARDIPNSHVNSNMVQISGIISGKAGFLTCKGRRYRQATEEEYRANHRTTYVPIEPVNLKKEIRNNNAKDNVILVESRRLNPKTGEETYNIDAFKSNERVVSALR